MPSARFGRIGLLAIIAGVLLIGGWWVVAGLPRVTGIDVGPDPDAVAVTARFSATFSEPLGPVSSDVFQFDPPVNGRVVVDGDRATFVPSAALLASTDYTLSVRGATTRDGRTVRPMTARFQTRAPAILYQTWDAADQRQLMLLPAGASEPVPLTAHPTGVGAYAVAPDGGSVAYVVAGPDQSTTLYRIDPRQPDAASAWLECPLAQCDRPVWSPDGDRLVIERSELAAPAEKRLFWVEPDGSTTPIFDDETVLGHNAVFSPDGDWLAFYSDPVQGVLLVDLSTGENVIVPTILDTPVVWQSDGGAVAFQDVVPFAESFGVRLLVYDLASGTTTSVTEDIRDDEAPWAWASDGTLFFGRKRAATAMGRQVIELPADAESGTPRTADADIQHTLVTLSPDEETLLMQQFDVNDPAARPGIWLLDRARWEMTPVADEAIRPNWLP